YSCVFNHSTFNAMQSECLDLIFYADDNVAVSAPTGCGKTVLMELAIVRTLLQKRNEIKIVYMAPTKSLCAERARDWSSKFERLGVTCKEFTGDTDYTTVDAISKCDLIVTTPEKWDSMTRRWKDNRHLVQMIKLFMIDEVHILNERRGAVLEACVSRMKNMAHQLRYMAVSATVPNLDDVAEWLNGKGKICQMWIKSDNFLVALSFSEEYRPVHLERFVYGIPFYGNNAFSFEKKIEWKLLDMINRHSNSKPTLIFCSTRKSAQSSCETLMKLMQQKQKLASFLVKGIAFHHAGLASDDRRAVERLFLEKKIRVISTTSTLAVGVNLPAHLVIIKGTTSYQQGRMVNYSDLDMLQMMGRAGRPGLDDSGCAVILTTPEMEPRYKSLISGANHIESSLHNNLAEHLMTEICLGTITNIETASRWIQSTFLYVRVKKNAAHYRLDSVSLNLLPDQILKELCISNLQKLHQATVASRDEFTGVFKSTNYGFAMSRYCIKLETMTLILQGDTMYRSLELVCKSVEFTTVVRFAAGDKPFLNSLQKNPNILFPLKDKVSCIADKVFLIIQVYPQTTHLVSNQTKYDYNFLILCFIGMIDCSAHERIPTKLKLSLELFRCLQARMWSHSPYILRQLDKIGPQKAKALGKAGIRTFDHLRSTDPGRIEAILHRNPPFG
ncbi:P-loop containing nucleoside triphosphate hydrolase protein, partial [Syncephalastrum racemosum]